MTSIRRVFNRSKTQIEGYVREGSILNKYIQVLTLLLRLRQACDHPYLCIGRGRTEKEWESDISNFISRFAARNLQHSIAEKGGMSVEYIAEIGETLKKMRRTQKKKELTLEEMTRGEEEKEVEASQSPSPSPTPMAQSNSASPRPLSPPQDDGEETEVWHECPVCLSPPAEPVLTEWSVITQHVGHHHRCCVALCQ